MSEVLFDKFTDLGSLEKEKQQVLSIFKEIEKGLLDLSALGFKIDAAKGVAALNDANKKLETTTKDLAAAQAKILESERRLNEEREKLSRMTKRAAEDTNQQSQAIRGLSGDMGENIRKQIELKDRLSEVSKSINKLKEFGAVAKGSAEYRSEMEKLVQEQVQLKIQIEQSNKFLKNQAREFNAAEGSLDEMRAKLNQMLQAYDAMGEAAKNTKFGQQALKTINELTDAIYEQETASKRFQRNVGNYQGSAKIIADAFERAQRRISELPKDIGKSGPEAKKLREEFNALQRIVEDPKFLKISAKYGDAIAETRHFTKALIDLERQQLGDSDAAQELRAHLAKLTDEISDTRQEVKALSSDTRSFDLFASSVGTAASVFQTMASSAELFGESNEDMEKSMRRLMAIQNVANGVRQIATDLTTRGTAANKVYGFVQTQVALLTNASTTAVQKFNAAMKLSIVGAIATGLLYLADAMGIFGGETSDAADEQERLNAAFEKTQKNLDEYGRYLDTEAKNQKLRIKLAKGTQEELDKIDKGTLEKKLEGVRIERDELEKQREAELHKVRGDREKYLEIHSKFDAEVEKLDRETARLQTEYDNNIMEGKIKNLEKEDSERKKRFDAAAEERKRQLEAERKASADLTAFRLQLAAAEQEALKNADIVDTTGIKFREEAAKTEFALRKKALEVIRDFELDSEKVTGSQRLLINEKTNDQIRTLEIKLATDLISIRQGANQAILDDAKQFQDDLAAEEAARLQKRQDANIKQLANFQSLYEKEAAEQRQAAAQNFAEGKLNQEQYAEELEAIELNKQQRILKASIKFYESQIKLMQAAGVDTLALEAALADARALLAEGNAKKLTKVEEDRLKAFKELQSAYKEMGMTLASTFHDVLQGGADARKNKLQEEIDKVNELRDAEVRRVMESTDSEEKKAARVALIQAKAQQDRENLERRQRAIDREKAKMERTYKSFQIVTDGIQAVNKIKLNALAAIDPITKGLILAQIPIALATQAAALVSLLATPIPKFAKGTSSSPAGAAIVGEAGRELGVEPSGRIKLWEKPTIANLIKGTRIFPNKVTEDILAAAEQDRYSRLISASLAPKYSTPDRTDEVVGELKKLNRRKGILIQNQSGIESTAYFIQQMKS